ncbi:hypothetical protein HNR57_007790 [Streptomyces paradoxus]|uniref:Transposase Helix-turn-helix domain-containing protein n=1 Tax=Streptomyces paradoxus TaxID=66375 RepID=A0A7W9TLY9_9ACTN|nr:hypothetical protein [Streptomyces paradoxus]
MLIVTRKGDRRCKLRPSQRAIVVAAGFGISESAAHAYTSAVIDLLADRAPGLLKVLTEPPAGDWPLEGPLPDVRVSFILISEPAVRCSWGGM